MNLRDVVAVNVDGHGQGAGKVEFEPDGHHASAHRVDGRYGPEMALALVTFEMFVSTTTQACTWFFDSVSGDTYRKLRSLG